MTWKKINGIVEGKKDKTEFKKEENDEEKTLIVKFIFKDWDMNKWNEWLKKQKIKKRKCM